MKKKPESVTEQAKAVKHLIKKVKDDSTIVKRETKSVRQMHEKLRDDSRNLRNLDKIPATDTEKEKKS